MVIHAQYVEIGNRRHLEKILALKTAEKTWKRKTVCFNPHSQLVGGERTYLRGPAVNTSGPQSD